MLRAVSEETAAENRKLTVVKSAISTLSYSEMEAIICIFDELNGREGILVASKIADRVGITRSVNDDIVTDWRRKKRNLLDTVDSFWYFWKQVPWNRFVVSKKALVFLKH